MNKGEKLGMLLDEGEAIEQQMNAVFTQYSIKLLDLKNLPKEGKDKWDQLFKQKDEIANQIGQLFKSPK